MDLSFSAEERAFRADVVDFVETRLPDDIRCKTALGTPLGREDFVAWQKLLNERGWAAPHWPVEYGGPGWGPTERYLYSDAIAETGAPEPLPFGLTMVGPVIYTFGTDAQKQRFLPAILAADELWCQGYSEPGAGSDLASLTSRAVRDGDTYVVNGTKTWTSLAHWADWMFCLVRTSNAGKPQEGISFLLIDMTTPGIEVRPIATIDAGHHVNMTYLTDVRVPVANRVGEENHGWTYAKFLLTLERTGIAEIGPSRQRLKRLKAIAAAEPAGAGALLDDAGFHDKVAAVEIDLTALEYTNLRYLAEEAAGRDIGAKASLLKVRGSEIRQRITELCVEALGYYAQPMPGPAPEGVNEPPIGGEQAVAAAPDFLFSRAATIYGGSNEIQKNIMAKMVLGL
jgi:alkylation response protein AidB-like acyl-CoA dehydrogenase